MGVIRIQDHNRDLHEVEAVQDWQVMEIICKHGLRIDGLAVRLTDAA